MQFCFRNQTIVVAGAYGGIGRRTAELFAECGGQVQACDVHEDCTLELFRRHDGDNGGTIRVDRIDMTDATQVTDYVGTVESQAPTGQIDAMIYAAGGVCHQTAQPIEEVSEQEFRDIVDANVTGLVNLVRAAVPAMKRGRKGRIITVSSRAGLGISRTGIQSYTVAKAGQIGLVRHLAKELGPFGITVNSIAPGFMVTNEASRKQWESYGDDGQQALLDGLFIKRLGKPEDIGYAALYFASPFAEWTTGQTLTVAGMV